MYRLCVAVGKKYVCRPLASIILNASASLVSLPFNLFLSLYLIVHFIFKWVVLLRCGKNKNSIFYGAGERLLKSKELGWVDFRHQSVMQAVLVFDWKINVSRIQELIQTRVIPLYPRLTHRICPLPYTANSIHCWMPDDKFNINDHVYLDEVVFSEKQLQNYVSKRIFEKLPIDKPPWELRILSCSDAESFSDTIIILRIHQSLVDAMTLIKILCTKLADTKAPYTAAKTHHGFNYYVRIVQAYCIGPAVILYRLVATLLARFWTKPEKTVDCSVNWSTSISLSKVERIKQVTRSSYNCVMLSAVTGAFRNLLQRSGIKHPPDLEVVLPVTLDKNQKYLPVAVKIPCSIEGAVPRLWQTKYALKVLCKSYDPFITFLISYIIMPLCPQKFRTHLNTISKKSATIQFSSILGPTSRLVIDGSPLKTMYTFLPSEHDLDVSVSVITYAGQICISIITNSTLTDIGKVLIKYIDDQIEQMYQLLMNRTVPEESSNEYIQDQLPDISHVSSRELKHRMQLIQREMQKLSELISYSEDDMKHLTRLKCEFHYVFRELKRRKCERLKGRRRSLILKGMDKVSTTFCRSEKKVILYSLPKYVGFIHESSPTDIVATSETSTKFSYTDETCNLERRQIQEVYSRKTDETNSGAILLSETRSLETDSTRIDSVTNNKCNMMSIVQCFDGDHNKMMYTVNLEQRQQLVFQLSANEHII